MTILYFAHARRLAGCSEETLPGDVPLTFQQLWATLLARHPDLASLRTSARLACNQRFADAETVFNPGDEVAVIPPVSGG